jgi:hypothetical protein
MQRTRSRDDRLGVTTDQREAADSVDSNATTRAATTSPLSKMLQGLPNCVDVTSEKPGTMSAIIGADHYRS